MLVHQLLLQFAQYYVSISLHFRHGLDLLTAAWIFLPFLQKYLWAEGPFLLEKVVEPSHELLLAKLRIFIDIQLPSYLKSDLFALVQTRIDELDGPFGCIHGVILNFIEAGIQGLEGVHGGDGLFWLDCQVIVCDQLQFLVYTLPFIIDFCIKSDLFFVFLFEGRWLLADVADGRHGIHRRVAGATFLIWIVKFDIQEFKSCIEVGGGSKEMSRFPIPH